MVSAEGVPKLVPLKQLTLRIASTGRPLVLAK